LAGAVLFHRLADVANWLGQRCVSRAERLQSRVAYWLNRGRFWRDVETWLRGKCSKSLADIRKDREDGNAGHNE